MCAAPTNDPLEEAASHLRVGRSQIAETICRQILASAPIHTPALRLLSLAMQFQGKLDQAMSIAQRAADIEPESPENWRRLAELSVDQRNYSQAAGFWRHAIALAPDQSYPHAALGWAVYELGNVPEAEEHLHAALRMNPKCVPAHLHLAELFYERNEMDRAEQSVRSVLEFDPLNLLALGRLASILGSKLSVEDIEKIEQLLTNPDLIGEASLYLLYPLAAVYDSRGNYSRAAQRASQANALRMIWSAKRNRLNNPDEHERFVDWTIQFFDRNLFQRLFGLGNPTTRPVFVFGLPRSGTTLVEQVLSSHSRVFGAGETDLCRKTFHSIPQILGCPHDPDDSFRRLDANSVALLADRVLSGLNAYDGGRTDRIVDKAPINYLYLGFLALIFPNAVFIHCRRDLRDVAVSCWLNQFRAFAWADDKSDLARRIHQYVRIMDHWRQVLPVKIHEIDYESIVSDFEASARQLIAVCGLEWEDRCLEFHRTRRAVRTNSTAQVRQPIYSKSVGRWKHYQRELADLFSQLPTPP
jgi:tetratricopeptide (TPR) repeat protein